MPGFGRRIAKDDRDRRFLIRTALPLLSPVERTLPWQRGATGDQGNTGTCVGHAGRAWYEMAPWRHRAAVGIGPFDLYRECVKIDEWAENDYEGDPAIPISGLQQGTSVRALFKVFQRLGLVDGYAWAFDAQTVADFVRRRDGSPVVMGTYWYSGMSDPAKKTGLVKVSGSIQGGHAWCVRWYDRRRGLFRCTNSWGDGFGVRGEFFLEHEGMEILMRQDGEAACGVERRAA
jgi:hypothetical protein